MLIRQALYEDLPSIVDIGKYLLNTHVEFDPVYYQLEDDFTSHFSKWAQVHIGSTNQFLLVAENDNLGSKKIIGFISGYIKPLFPWFKHKKVGHISFLAVDKKYQRKGIGRALEKKAIGWFKDKNVEFVELYTNEKNTGGSIVFSSYGYLPFNKFLRKKI